MWKYLLSNIIHANLCSEIRLFHLIINFYNFDSTKIIIKGKLLRKVSFMIRNQFQEARSKIQRMCISLLCWHLLLDYDCTKTLFALSMVLVSTFKDHQCKINWIYVVQWGLYSIIILILVFFVSNLRTEIRTVKWDYF